MKKTFLKKLLLGLLVCATVMSSASCSGKNKALNAIEGKDGLYALLETEKGTIALELFYKETPMTVANFVGLAEGTLNNQNGKPFYDGLTFHRVIDKFMAQGGDPAGNGTGGPDYQFPDEFVEGLEFDAPGKLAMANAGPGTNGSQFFITTIHTEWLNNKHTIFGQVAYGQDIVDAIEQGDHIKKLTIVRNGPEAEKFVVDQAFFDKKIEENVAREEARIAKILADFTEGFEKTEDGILYQILEEGAGLPCGERVNVGVEYMGYLLDGTIFDASKGMNPNGHDPLFFVTGIRQMITGFDTMVQQMKLGEVRRMVLPPEQAYGAQGIPGVIPPNSYICFDVQLFKF